MTIREIRALTGLSQVKFSKKYGIPRRTIEDWEAGRHDPPAYLEDLLEFRIRHDLDLTGSCSRDKMHTSGGKPPVD